MKLHRKLASAILIFCSTFKADASTQYQLTYAFSGDALTASFTGTAYGDQISNLSDISVWFNGVAFNGNGHLFNYYYNLHALPWEPVFIPNAAVISFDGLQNNFHFTNARDSQLVPDYSTYNAFDGLAADPSLIGGPNIGIMTPNAMPFIPSFDPINQTWNITEVNAVSEPATSVLLVFGLLAASYLPINRRLDSLVISNKSKHKND